MVGYGGANYRFWDRETDKIVVLIDITFDEEETFNLFWKNLSPIITNKHQEPEENNLEDENEFEQSEIQESKEILKQSPILRGREKSNNLFKRYEEFEIYNTYF